MTNLIRWYFRLIKKSPNDFEMVHYWKTKSGVQAKVTKAKDGSTHMIMEGEKYAFPTFPRGHILFGHLSKIKHEIKNQIFNESWKQLEEGKNKPVFIYADAEDGLLWKATRTIENPIQQAESLKIAELKKHFKN